MTNTPSSTSSNRDHLMAAIDLGSNSFHMVLAEQLQGEFRILDKRGEKVRLAEGLDWQNNLSPEAMQRGWDCLKGFAQHVAGLEQEKVVVLATNALRVARNRQKFIDQAEEILGFPIEVIAGREEARLVYMGVCHSLSNEKEQRLVVDIGGGSTEFIIGQRFDPIELESLHMGCVSYNKAFFADGVINKLNFARAIKRGEQELLNIKAHYEKVGWQEAIGSSGTIRTVEQVGIQQGWSDEGITLQSLAKINQTVLDIGVSDELDLPGLKLDRKHTFVAGLAIVNAIFNTFKLKKMRYCDGALREGVLWDVFGQHEHQDVRQRTVQAMQQRFHVDVEHASSVQGTALELVAQLKTNSKERFSSLEVKRLAWAACLFEIGLSISHSNFQKHGAYFIAHGDMLGFTKQGQQLLSFLIRAHRRKFPKDEWQQLAVKQQKQALRLAVILRLSVLLHHSRKNMQLENMQFSTDGKNSYRIEFDKDWLAEHSLIEADLMAERDYLKTIEVELAIEVR